MVIHPKERWSLEGFVKVTGGKGRLAKSDDFEGFADQPFFLFLHTFAGNGRVLLRCVSPMESIDEDDDEAVLQLWKAHRKAGFGKICATPESKLHASRLSIEADLLFHPDHTQLEEVEDLIRRTAECAGKLRRTVSPAEGDMDILLDEEEQHG